MKSLEFSFSQNLSFIYHLKISVVKILYKTGQQIWVCEHLQIFCMFKENL